MLRRRLHRAAQASLARGIVIDEVALYREHASCTASADNTSYEDGTKKFERIRIDLRGDVHPMIAPRAKQPIIDLAR